jgi:hypothetical protein
MNLFIRLTFCFLIILGVTSCNQQNNEKASAAASDSAMVTSNAEGKDNETTFTTPNAAPDDIKQDASGIKKEELPVVLVYNFHVTNRCASCIAIEEATTKTLNTYFSEEIKQGRIKRQIINVDLEENKEISEKYEAFGSGIVVSRVYQGKETTSDLTGSGFRYAKNKEEKFIELLRNKILQDLKY